MSLGVGQLGSSSFRRSSFLLRWVDILLYLISFGCVLDDKEPLNLIGWLVKDKVDF